MKTLITILILCITSSAIAQIPSYIPSNGLVGWWPFNGNANDESGNGNNGTPGSGVTLISDRFGTSNSAYDFNGYGNISLLNLPTTGSSDFTITSWVKTNDLSVRKGIACWGQDSPWQGTYFYVTANGNLKFDFAYNGGPQSPSFIADNSWHFVGITCTNGLIQLYINGIASGASLQMSPNVNGANKALGANIDNSANNNFIGSLDDFGIWNRALTPTEITNLYNSINTPAPTVSVSPSSTTICPGNPTTLTASACGSTACSSSGLPTSLQTGLVGYWPFCGNANDASGNGNNGTVNGATLTSDRYGNTSSAYNFNGSSNYIDVGNNNSLNSNIVTISAWYNAVDYGSSAQGFQGNLVSKREQSGWGGAYQLALMSNPSNLVYAPYTIAGQNGNVYSTLQPLGQWIHVVYVHDLNSARIYINGVLSGTTLVSGGLTFNNLPVWFGARPNAGGLSHFFNGKLDDIAIWNRALTATEIQQLYTTSDATYSWSPGGETTPSITVSPTTTTTYTVTATANGQSSTSSAVVTVTTPPTITPSSSSICAGESTTLTATTNSNTCANLTGSLSSGLVGYWPFCGNANDVSGNGNHGTVNGATLTTDRFGNSNSAYNFSGSNDIVISSNFYNNGLTNSTISLWFNTASTSQLSQCIYNTIPHDGEAFVWNHVIAPNLINHFKNQNTSINLWNIFGANTLNYSGIQTNNWIHISIVKSNLTYTYFVNGNIDKISISTIAAINEMVGMRFGSSSAYGGSEYFIGKLDDIAIWNRALTTAEIQQLYTQGQTTYSWSPGGATTPSITVSPTSTTTYTCSVTTNGTTCSSDQVITVNPIPLVNAGVDQSVCMGSNVTLSATGATTYAWSGGVQNGVAFAPTSSGTYTVTGTSNGCSATDEVQVTVNPLPTVNAGLDQTICQGVSTVLNASSNGTSLSWNNGVQNNISFVPSTVGTTTYTATATGSNGCTAIDNVVLTVFNNPVANAGLDATITCVQNASGTQIGDVQNPTYTYGWTPATGLNSATIGNPIAHPSTTTTYTVMVVNANGCMGSDQVTVTVNNTPPTANAGLDQSICMGASLVLQGSTNGASGTWNNGVTNGIPFTPSQIGTTSYTYSSIGANGCVNNDQVSVTVNALPVANSGQGAVITCVQNVNGVQLGANPISGNTYTWTPTSGLNNSNTANPTATPNATTTYTLLMSDANGCSDTAQVVVTVNNNPPIVAAGNDANVCNGDSLYLFANATAGTTVVWNGTIQNGSNILPAQSGFQVATATALNGCTAQDSLLVTILQPTTSTLNEVACDEFVLNGNVYLQTGTYTQLLTNAAGCDSTITLNLTINLSPATPVVYVQNEVNLSTDVVLGQTYQWIYCSDMVPVPAATNPTFNPTANAIYAVVVTNNCGADTSSCTTVSTIGLADHAQTSILVYPNPGNDQIHIQINEALLNTNYEIYDLNGRVLQRGIFNQILNDLYLGNFARGVYTLRTISQYPIQIIKQ